MPTYVYTAREGNGNASNGTVTANSVTEVTQLLRREGKYPTKIELAGDLGSPAGTGGGPVGRQGIKIPRPDVIQLSNQLAIMVETGVTLSEALECVAQQTDKPKVRALLDDVLRVVHSGTDLSTALARHE